MDVPGQIAAPPPAPAVPQQVAPPPIPTPQPTPVVNYVPAPTPQAPGTPPPAPQPAPTPQLDSFATLRHQVAQHLGIRPEEVPSDPTIIAKAIAGGYQASQRLQAIEAQRNQPQPGQFGPTTIPSGQPQANGQPTNPLAFVPMVPGWETMVSFNQQTKQYEPVHQNFATVAQAANYNEYVKGARSAASNQGQLLPEQQQSVDQIVQSRLAQQREVMAGEMFMEQNGKDLFEHDAQGNRVKELNIATGNYEDKPSELGIELRAAAAELKASANFNSQADLAKLALKLAKERIKLKQSATPPATQQQQTVQNRDLETLLAQHQQAGARGVANVTGVSRPIMDVRSALRNDLASMPENASGVEYARALGFGL